MLEKTVENYLCWVVEMKGGKALKFTSPSNRGVADRIVCMPDGSTHFVELKSPTGKRSRLQVEFAGQMALLNQSYAVLGTTDEVDGWMQTLC